VPEKPKTPKPPRPVQAPKRRDGKGSKPAGPSFFSRVPRWAWLVGGAVLIAVIAGSVFAFGGGSSNSATTDVKATMLAAGCTYLDKKPYPPKDKTNYHADSPTLTTKVKWATFPPSAGGHYPLWAVWGFYTSPVNPRQVVHNEEHGAVVLWWGPKVPQSTISQLQDFYESSPVGMFGTPTAGLGDKIALTAWTGNPAKYYRGSYGIGHVAICKRFDQKAFTTFRDAYRGHGPEGIPLHPYDEPGQGPN
jgi:Protein of unknown function (DUF3105)